MEIENSSKSLDVIDDVLCGSTTYKKKSIATAAVATFPGCDVCGDDHETQFCPILEDSVKVDDARAPSRAKLTVPGNLRIKTLKDGHSTVVAREKIPANTRFGPFEARKVAHSPRDDARFLLKVFDRDGSGTFLDSANEETCNWMCLVQPAETLHEQNLMAFQMAENVFFSSKRDIRMHEELKVWYAPHYGKKMGINPPWTSADVEKEICSNEETCTATSVTSSAVTDECVQRRERKKKIFEGYVEYADDSEELDEPTTFVAPKHPRLGLERHREWKCSQCGEVYHNCTDFACHLREHYNPRKISEKRREKSRIVRPKCFACRFCSSRFSSGRLLQKHQLRLHRRQLRRRTDEKASTRNEIMAENNDSVKMDSDETATASLASGLEKLDEILFSRNDENTEMEKNAVEGDPAEGGNPEPLERGTSDDHSSYVDELDATVCERQESLLKVDNAVKNFVCDICDKSFDKSIYLFRHICKHTGDFVCPKCQKVFARKENLLKHDCGSPMSAKAPLVCNYCRKMFGSRQLLKRHMTKHTGDHTCEKCGKSYCSSGILKSHVCTKSSNLKLFSCGICHKTFTKRKYLEKHVPVHTGAHACPICGKWLRSQDSRNNHMRICGQAKELEMYGLATCPQCKQEFRDLQQFRRHLYEHTHTITCEKCGARFRNKSGLGLHVCGNSVDVGCVCEQCGKVFKNSADLGVHKVDDHENSRKPCSAQGEGEEEDDDDETLDDTCEDGDEQTERRKGQKQLSLQPLVCEVCGSLFSSTSSLNVHRRLHGEKLFSCQTCDKRFHRKDLLLDHCAVHREPAIPCPVCSKMFKTKKSLDVHLLIHDGVKKYSCTTCKKEFHQKGNLLKHQVVHNPATKYPCTFCAKAFSSKEYLSIHLLEHTRGRIFTCGTCDKSFVKEHQLKSHQRVFHTSLSYVCKFCGINVKLKHSLKRHLNSKHADQSHLWNSTKQMEEMLVQVSRQVAVAAANTDEGSGENESIDFTDGKVLFAVTGIESEALKEALASGSAHIQQGTVPNTIEISLPLQQALQDVDGTDMADFADEMHAHIIHLATAAAAADVSYLQAEEEQPSSNDADQEAAQHLHFEVSPLNAVNEAAHITVVNDAPLAETLPDGAIVFDNNSILQHGITSNKADILFYVLTSDEQNLENATAEESC